jgi:cytoskeletal protein RodZ
MITEAPSPHDSAGGFGRSPHDSAGGFGRSPQGPAGGFGPSPDDSAEGFGPWLMRQRELRGVTLEQISEQTRIGVGTLKALEKGAEGIPRVYMVGYLRAYARVAGLDAQEALLRWEEEEQKRGGRAAVFAAPRRRPGLSRAAAVLALAAAAAVLVWLLARG